MKALIDGDVLLYQAVHQGVIPMSFDGEHYLYAFDKSELMEIFSGAVFGICAQLEKKIDEAIAPVICLSDSRNFRKSRVDKAYKANRPERKPAAFGVLKEAVIAKYSPIIQPYLEADDVMGVLHTQSGRKNTVVCSIDKDMFTLPGYYYNTDHDELNEVTPTEAEQFFLEQVLIGDRVDNYFGCPRIGEKTAKKKLTEQGYCWETVVGLFQAAGLTSKDALRNARCAFILQKPNYSFDTKKIKLWTPENLKKCVKP